MTRISPRSIAGVFVTLLAIGSAVASAQSDPRIGKWKVNLAKSKYELGPAPKSDMRTYEATADGTKTTVETTPANGSPTTATFTAKFDGKDYPISGGGPFDMISMKRVNGTTTEVTLKKDGKVVQHVRAVVSKDGRTMTNTVTRPDAPGKKTVIVWDKQP
jgi:hypothetical protein